MKQYFVIVFSCLLIYSCKKDPNPGNEHPVAPVIVKTNSVNFKFSNVVGSMPLTIGTQTYVNFNQDTFTVDIFKYYISNIKLKRDDGFEFAEPESYRLLSQTDSNSCNFTISGIPLGNYISMEFIIGVDSARNCSGAQTGALDPINDMFWDWSQGYIFAKMEGLCNRCVSGSFFHHVGGFEGQWNAIVKANPSFGLNLIQVKEGSIPKVYLKADLLEWFQNPNIIDLANYNSVAMGKKATEIASNYSDMFTITAIVND